MNKVKETEEPKGMQTRDINTKHPSNWSKHQIKVRKGKMNWAKWLKGLFSAVIGGVANGITVALVEPTSFNFQDGIHKLATVCFVSAVIAIGMYLKQDPIPSDVLR